MIFMFYGIASIKSRHRDVGWPLLMINKFLKDVFYGKFGWSLTPLPFGRSIISYGCIFRFCKKNSRTYYNWMSSSSTKFTLRSDGNPALFAFNCDTFKIIVFFFLWQIFNVKSSCSLVNVPSFWRLSFG